MSTILKTATGGMLSQFEHDVAVSDSASTSTGLCTAIRADLNVSEAVMSGSPLVQYIIIRKDLLKVLKWSVGAVVAQACHATAAVTHLFHDDPQTKKYLEDLDSMHKIILETPDEDSIKALENELLKNGIQHKIWIEKPENIPTCLVLKPYPKDQVQCYFKKLKLFKDD